MHTNDWEGIAEMSSATESKGGGSTKTQGAQNLACMLTETASSHGERIALKLDDTELSYEKLAAASERAAGLIRGKGVEPGDRVAVMLPNVPYFAILYNGILRAGAVVVPLNPRYGRSEVAYHVGDSEAKLLFGWHQFADAAEQGAGEHDVETIAVEPEKFEELLGDAEPDSSVGDHGIAEGRSADAWKHRQEHRGGDDVGRDERERRDPRCVAVLSRVRPGVWAQ
jgi:acyl-CoA synthetase (AMP-forming)/AMP-acid ligase II